MEILVIIVLLLLYRSWYSLQPIHIDYTFLSYGVGYMHLFSYYPQKSEQLNLTYSFRSNLRHHQFQKSLAIFQFTPRIRTLQTSTGPYSIEDKKTHAENFCCGDFLFCTLSVKFHFSQFCHGAFFVRLVACSTERVECFGPTIPLFLIYLIPRRRKKKNK